MFGRERRRIRGFGYPRGVTSRYDLLCLILVIAICFIILELISRSTSRGNTLIDIKWLETVNNLTKPGIITNRQGSTTATNVIQSTKNDRHDDINCPFKDSPIYRKVYVYPNYGDVHNGWSGDILSESGQKWQDQMKPWPWLQYDQWARQNATGHYNIYGQNVQYTTELLIREIMINPLSCLRTMDPETAVLFFVPYLPSIEHHQGHEYKLDYSLSPWGNAINEILVHGQYEEWEKNFGLTSKYWKRMNGSDHILTFSEPMHGLSHPRNRRGNYHFIHTQKQLDPPIVISIELSTTFIQMYPSCAAKNILVPYPNTDGGWFNSKYDQETQNMIQVHNLTTVLSPGSIPAERILTNGRPLTQFYSAGNHGTCKGLRVAMSNDYKKCTKSYQILSKMKVSRYAIGMRLTTFCPCPGGDSPSAKRMYDALLAGCIPVILSDDFVWPFTNEFDSTLPLKPSEFSIRLNASEFDKDLLDDKTCRPLDPKRPGLQAYLESIPVEEIQRLRQGVDKARYLYSWYTPNPRLPDNPLKEGILPDGGTAHFVVEALAKRAGGTRWQACKDELSKPRKPDPTQFKC